MIFSFHTKRPWHFPLMTGGDRTQRGLFVSFPPPWESRGVIFFPLKTFFAWFGSCCGPFSAFNEIRTRTGPFRSKTALSFAFSFFL